MEPLVNIFFLVLVGAGLIVWWAVSASRRRELADRVSQLQRRVYGLEEQIRALTPRFTHLSASEQALAQQAGPAPVAAKGMAPKSETTPPQPESFVWKLRNLSESQEPGTVRPAASTARIFQEPTYADRAASEKPAIATSSVSKRFERGGSLLNLEERLGTNWLNKLGIIIFVIGVALFLAYQLRSMGPAGKILAGYLTAAAMLGAGVFFEQRASYRVLARAGIGGGWALLFFTTYAMYHVPASRVLASQGLDLVFMLAVAALMVIHTLRYRSQAVTGLAFLLAFSTVTISHVNVYSLSASAILALGLVIVVARMRWFELEIFGILATYLNHYLWLRPIIEPMGGRHHSFSAFAASTVLLIFYWAVFRASYLLRRIEAPREEHGSSISALLNPLLLLLLMNYQAIHPDRAWRFLLFLGAGELLLGQLPITRRRRDAFVILSTLGVLLLMLACPFHFSGRQLSLLWLIASEVMVAAGVFRRETLFRKLGLLAGLVTAGHMVLFDALSVFDLRTTMGSSGAVPGRTGSDVALGLLFAVATVMFYADAHWLSRLSADGRDDDLSKVLFEWISYAAGALALVGAWLLWPGVLAAVAWAVLALILASAGRRLKIYALSIQGFVMGGAAILRTLFENLNLTASHSLNPARVLTVSTVPAALYLIAYDYSDAEVPIDGMSVPARCYAWAASLLIAILAWRELRPDVVVLAWAALGLALFESGMARRSSSLRLQAYVITVLAVLRMFIINLGASSHAGRVGPPLTTLALAFAWFYIHWRLTEATNESMKWDTHIRAASVYSFLGTLTIAALARFELAQDWVAPAWAGMALMVVVIAWLTKRRVFLLQGSLLAFAVLLRAIAYNLYQQPSASRTFWESRAWLVGAVVALLSAALILTLKLRAERPQGDRGNEASYRKVVTYLDLHPEQVFFFIPFVLLTWLLGVELRHGLVTLGWGVEGMVVFVAVLRAGERSFRLSALGLLLLCVLKIALIDVWGLAGRDRYVTFITMGAALLVVSFLYSKYREVLRQYL
jgi:Predicted membrane protein (DUF2339)